MDTDKRPVVYVVIGPHKELIAVCSGQNEANKIKNLYGATVYAMPVRD